MKSIGNFGLEQHQRQIGDWVSLHKQLELQLEISDLIAFWAIGLPYGMQLVYFDLPGHTKVKTHVNDDLSVSVSYRFGKLGLK